MTKTPELPILGYLKQNSWEHRVYWQGLSMGGTPVCDHAAATAALQQANEMAEGLSRQNEALHRVCRQKEESIAAAERERDDAIEAIQTADQRIEDLEALLSKEFGAGWEDFDAASLLRVVTRELKIATHQIITCGVAATHPDPNLTRTGAYASKWNSQQAEQVRKLRSERDALAGALALLADVYDAMGAPRGPARIAADAALSSHQGQEK